MILEKTTFIDRSAPYISAAWLNNLQDFVATVGKMVSEPCTYIAASSSGGNYVLSGNRAEAPAANELPMRFTFIPSQNNTEGATITAPWGTEYPIYDKSINGAIMEGIIRAGQPVDFLFDGSKFWVAGDGNYLQYGRSANQSGYFDKGDSTPTGTTRLNYSGYMYATRFYGAVYNPSSADVAEGYNVCGKVSTGEVVAIYPDGSIWRNDIDSNPCALGIVSDEYAVLLGTKYGSTPIAECGRVHAKVSGDVHAGDLLCSDNDGGLRVCSADNYGCILARALETKLTDATQKILVHIERR